MKAIRFILKYASNYITPLVLTMLSMVLLVAADLAVPWVIRSIIAAIQGPADNPDSVALITQLALIGLVVYIAKGGLRFVRLYMAHVAGWGVVADCRRQIYEHLQKLSLGFYENRQTGQLMSQMVNDWASASGTAAAADTRASAQMSRCKPGMFSSSPS